MSLYRRLRPIVPFHFVETGWNGANRTYFVRAYDVTGQDLGIEPRTHNMIYEAGTNADRRLSTLYDLVTCSWSLIQWPNELRTLEKLAVDPFLDVHEQLARTVRTQADRDPREDIRNILGLIYGRPLRVDLPPPRSFT